MAETAPRPPTAEAMLPRPFRVLAVRNDLADTFTLDLEAEDGQPLTFQPGQFNMLWAFGVGEVPISISGDPARPQVLTHTTRAVGAVTNAMWRLTPGQSLGVRGPFGKPWPIDAARGRDVVVVAGGIGLAPLRPLIYSLLADRAAVGTVQVLVGARTPEDVLFADELRDWQQGADLSVHVTVDRATSGWTGTVGVVTNLIGRGGFDPANTTAFVCGPEIMMRFAAEALIRKGVGRRHIFLSMERNMKCAVGFCGHCQWGGRFVCKDGPVFDHATVGDLLSLAEY